MFNIIPRNQTSPLSQSRLYYLILLLCLAITFINSVHADDQQAREIMQKVEDRDDGDNRISDLEMILIDKNGNQRVRKMRQSSKDKGEDKQNLIFFLHPADVKDTGFLTYDYDAADKDDDQWLYLPALRKSKRIASSDKSGSFMGSDFNYSDMTSRNLEDYDFKLLKESKVGDSKVWMIEALPRSQDVIEETGYEKSIAFVRQDNYIVIRAINWIESSKKIRYMEIKKLELIDDIWVGTEVTMTTKKGKETLHKTIIRSSNVKFNQSLDDSFFSVRQLEKGL